MFRLVVGYIVKNQTDVLAKKKGDPPLRPITRVPPTPIRARSDNNAINA